MKWEKKYVWRLCITAGLGILLFELYTQIIPISLVPIKIEERSESEPYYPRLVCRITNTHFTSIRYAAVTESMSAYEINDASGTYSNSWCTGDFSFTLTPFSSREIWIWVPNLSAEFSVSVFYQNNSLFSALCAALGFSTENRASVIVNPREIATQ